ncbi:MAG: 2,3-bisphosphoglycerate-independent phosphoglycerate mutase [Verrucomicrobiales bacterium]|nr:2,3-bisphosphoglycerate-independent phosphoglycerate mutase [Verrucomicrobiales bacterium]
MSKKPCLLVIRDGWGINPDGSAGAVENGDATLLAETPFHDYLFDKYPISSVSASGEDVGLPAGQMGNSEVGHLNLGAGRIVFQDLSRINNAIKNGDLRENKVLQKAFAKAKNSKLHLIGLVSDGGVHSHQDHLIALAGEAKEAGVNNIKVHAITDGRDTSPTGAQGYLSYCEDELGKIGVRITTVIGRYYAMDRDRRWDRSKLAWDAIVHGRGECAEVLPSEAITIKYAADKTDEFLPPMIFDEYEEQRVNDGDVVLWFNFRADRARQISEAFLFNDFEGFDREVLPAVHYYTLTEYDEKYDCDIVFPSEKLDDVLGAVVGASGKTQLRIAETEKYPHVTYFFNGGEETPFKGEDRVIVPSPKVATYDLQPEMSAPKVTEEIISRLKDYDLVILNFANPDMVGHTGIVEAAKGAVNTIDSCLEQVIDEVIRLEGKALVTSDHGNCEQMIKSDGSPHTAHTTNLVHLIYVAQDAAEMELRDGILADISPTILDMLGLEVPNSMSGSSLISKKS